jgi:two-component system sensor kinase FixL
MQFIRESPWYAEANRERLLATAALLIVVIGVVDWATVRSLGLGFLYFFPIVLASGFLSRWQIVVVALVCAVWREAFSYLPAGPERLPRVAFVFLAFVFVGFFVREMVIYRRAALQHLQELEREVGLRQRAEQQLDVLINSSPAGIVTVSPEGKIVISNEAAHQIFGVPPGALPGQPVGSFLPLLAQVQGTQAPFDYRTALECRGRRANGEAFLAHVWLSTFASATGPAMAAIVLDASEDLRDREETGLRQLLAGSRIMVAAVSHEIRNLVGAIAMVHANLGRVATLHDNQDFKALGDLVEGLRSVASSNIFLASEPVEGVDLASLLENFRIVVGPAAKEAQCEVSYQLPTSLPRVRGHQQRLLQVFLNLATNSFRALQETAEKRLAITVARDGGGGVAVEFQDSGPGVASPDLLFRPFQRGAESSGLGLYVSRAIVRSFAGDLRYEPRPAGACFIVELAPAGPAATVTPTAGQA